MQLSFSFIKSDVFIMNSLPFIPFLEAIEFLSMNKMINRKLRKALAAGVRKFIQVLTLPQDVVRQ